MNKLNLLILLWQKAFEKQTKTIEDQGKKQIDALANLKSLFFIYDYFIDKMAEIRNSHKIDFNNLKHTFKDKNNAPIDFIGFKGPLRTFKSIHNTDITLEVAEENQIKSKLDLGHIRQGNPKNRSEEQNNVINNVTNLYNSRGKVIQMFNNSAKDMSRNIYKSKQGRGRLILSLTKMLQRLPIALTQIKTGNNSEGLLNESRQIVYSLSQAKTKIPKKYIIT